MAKLVAVALAVVAVLVVAALVWTGDPVAAPPGKVWSAEHGHWHDAP